MERMLVVVFENEAKAYEGSRALKALDYGGSISIYAEAVIKKNNDGTVTIAQVEDDFPVRTLGGTAIGGLIGLLGGPIGVVVGAAGGTLAGSIWDLDNAGVNAEFLDDVSVLLTPGKWAVVAEISEEWVTPVDFKMEALGGTVFRMARADVEYGQYTRDVVAIKADIAQFKAEQAMSRGDHKAKLQAKIDNSQEKLRHKLEQAKQKSEQREKETGAKVQALEKKAAEAKGEAKAVIEARIEEIRKKSRFENEEMNKIHDAGSRVLNRA